LQIMGPVCREENVLRIGFAYERSRARG
jgi:hypothetical protein